MDKQLITGIVNYLLSIVGVLFLLVLLKNLVPFAKSRQWKWKVFLEKIKNPLFGVFIILISYALVNALLSGAGDLIPLSGTETSNPSTLREAFLQIDYTGIFGVILFIIAGTFYILSGFSAWLRWPGRVFMILAPAYILIQILRYAILAA